MKRFLSLLMALLLLTSCAAAESPAATPMPTTPPNAAGMPYILDDYAIAPVKLSDWQGTVTYLNFFTTWCTYCRMEMQDLKALQAEYGDNLRVVLVHIPSGEDEATARAYLEKEGLADMNFVEDNGFFSYMFGINSFPISVIIDADGYLANYVPGMISLEQMRQVVEQAGATLPEASDAL